jgi:arylsulfatase A-like enzyme
VTADHGRYVGAHGFDAHNFGPFEEIYRVPLLVSGPGVSEGESCDAPVCLHDLCPTICEWGGAEVIDVPDSCSLVPAMAGEPIERSGAYAESQGTRFSLTQRIWWQGKWKFAFNGFDFDELYDLEADPGETTNLARMPEYRDTVERMMREVWREIRETGDRAIEETHYFSMRMGVVGPDV